MTKRQQIVRESCEQFPDKSSHSIARALFKKYPREFITYNAAYTMVRRTRGSQGIVSNKKPVPRSPSLPPSAAVPWEVFYLDGKKIGALSDLHIPYHDVKALRIAVLDLKKEKCDTILLNGDVVDYYMISRFDKSRNRPSVKEELQMVYQFLKYLRHHFPKARIVWKLGNHEERWEHYLLQRAPEIFDLTHDTWQEEAGLEEHKVEVVRDGRIIMAGKLPILHGHELPKGITNPVNPARGAFLRTLDCSLISHHHRTSEHTERTMLGKIISSKSMGCLCHLEPDYARINRWDHGFAVIKISSDGNYHCILKKIINGKVFG